MKAIDRIILIALVAGVWALVLKPGTPVAHHEGAKHDCSLDGAAYGYVSGSQVVIPTLGSLIVSCKHK